MANSNTHPFIRQMACIMAVQRMLLHPQAPRCRQERAQYSIVGAMLHHWIGRRRLMMQRFSFLRWVSSCMQSGHMRHNNSASFWRRQGSVMSVVQDSHAPLAPCGVADEGAAHAGSCASSRQSIQYGGPPNKGATPVADLANRARIAKPGACPLPTRWPCLGLQMAAGLWS